MAGQRDAQRTGASLGGTHRSCAFNQDAAQAIPVPPPPEIDWTYVDQLRAIAVQIKPVDGVPDLMHHKYVIRDASTPAAALLTGSTNWTNDSWTREENVIVTLASTPIIEPDSMQGLIAFLVAIKGLASDLQYYAIPEVTQRIVDLEAEKARLGKEAARLQGEVTKANAKLSNQAFVAKAPPTVIEQERKRIADFAATLSKIEDQLKRLG